MNVKFDIESPVYVFLKSHFCPDCGARVSITTDSYICDNGDSGSEAFNFSFGPRAKMIGRTKFIWFLFKCKKCEKRITVQQMKKIEGVGS